ncbi:hypothetical protein ACFL0V_01670 [Nanoarchaeota archaeon]
MTKNKGREKRKDYCSDSHKLDKEMQGIFKDLESVNKKHNPSKISVRTIYIVFCLTLISLIITAGSTVFVSKERVYYIQEQLSISEMEIFAEQIGKIEGANYGATIQRFMPQKYQNNLGEEVVLESLIRLNGINTLDAEVAYQVYNPKGDKVYDYSDTARVSDKSILKKKILITENYMTGFYVVDLKLRFTLNETDYMIPGKTVFEIKDKPSILMNTGYDFGWLNVILIVMILAMNIGLMRKSWRLYQE